jgi:hypothetical protein
MMLCLYTFDCEVAQRTLSGQRACSEAGLLWFFYAVLFQQSWNNSSAGNRSRVVCVLLNPALKNVLRWYANCRLVGLQGEAWGGSTPEQAGGPCSCCVCRPLALGARVQRGPIAIFVSKVPDILDTAFKWWLFNLSRIHPFDSVTLSESDRE